MAKAPCKSTPITESGKLVAGEGSVCTDNIPKVHQAGAVLKPSVNFKPFLQAEIKAAIKRGQDAKKVRSMMPPNPVGRPPGKKYASKIAEAVQKIEKGEVDLTDPHGLTKLVETLTDSPAAHKTIRNNLQAAWDAALKKRSP